MRIFIVGFFVLLFGCATRMTAPAPIVDGIAGFATASAPVAAKTNTVASVKTGNSEAASTTKVTRLTPTASATSKTSSSKKVIVAEENTHESASEEREGEPVSAPKLSTNRNAWMMPAQGEIIGKYSSSRKGIDIKAPVGADVVAASNGKVVYSGNGLKGYGNLIIIKHANGYLTAYALNKVNLVNVGQEVKCGDKIAKIGKTGVLHFELRKDGKPINPDYINGK